MQAVDTGGPIVGCHDGSEDARRLGDGSWPRFGDLDVLLPEGWGLFVEAGARVVAHVSMLALRAGRVPSFERVAQAEAEGVFLAGKLVDEISRVGPQREVGVGGGGVERRAGAVPVVVVEQMGGVAGPWMCRRGEGVERNVGRPPRGRDGRNLEGGRLVGAA